ncbi:MAG: 16S rRNA (adenine(1518)-N(6)/adenine(1519)-N(6))-dimethyltransferase RsmA [Nitrospiria bacterium]
MSDAQPRTINPKNVRAKKKWGQNFLIDANIRRKILDCAEIQTDERVVEIGPGKGFLTRALLERGASVTAIEIDPDLIKIIQSEMKTPLDTDQHNVKKLNLIHADALRYDYKKLSTPYKVVANLPYYISTPLLFKLLEERAHTTRMVLMLQKEVAERMAAPVGHPAYGALSIVLQFYTDVNMAFTVSPNCFQPRPKVASAVVSITPLETPRVPVRDETLFLKIVKGAFLYRRKKLDNALRFAGFSEPWIKKALKRSHCDGERRGETLSMAAFAALANAFLETRQASRQSESDFIDNQKGL